MVLYAANNNIKYYQIKGIYMKRFLFVFVMAAAVFAQAALLTFEGGSKALNGVDLKATATINDKDNKPTVLKMDILGAGLRNKTVLIAEVKVYVAQLFSDNKAGFSRDPNTALTSLVQSSSRIVLKLDMLRTVSASSLVTSFKEALAANNYTLDAELTNALSLMEKAANATSGKSITLLMTKDNSKTNLYYEDTMGVLVSMVGSPEMMTKILSIWLGKPVDDGLAALKKQLLNPVY